MTFECQFGYYKLFHCLYQTYSIYIVQRQLQQLYVICEQLFLLSYSTGRAVIWYWARPGSDN